MCSCSSLVSGKSLQNAPPLIALINIADLSAWFTGNYLGGVKLHLTGCAAEERTELRMICRHGNAMAYVTLDSRIRFVVVRLVADAERRSQLSQD